MYEDEQNEILSERDSKWGTFKEFVDISNELKDSLRLRFKNIRDIDSLRLYRLHDFTYEMLILKLARCVMVSRKLECVDYTDERIKDCYIDFVNYCKLAETEMEFWLSFKTLKTDTDWGTFFEKAALMATYNIAEEDLNEVGE